MNLPLKIACSHFPVSKDIKKNTQYIKAHMEKAAFLGADIVHFPETALSGYARVHFDDFSNFDWECLDGSLKEICDLARKLYIWVVLGSTSYAGVEKPTNCLHVISDLGNVIGTYHKRRLYSREKEFYSPGNEALVVNIKGVKCGFLICYDSCYPDLYTDYRAQAVQVIFQSFYNANNKIQKTDLNELAVAQLRTRAADNQFWISGSNSSEEYSAFPSSIIRPDGSLKQVIRHKTELIVEDLSQSQLGWMYDNRIM